MAPSNAPHHHHGEGGEGVHGHPQHDEKRRLREAILKATACRLCKGDKIDDLEVIEFTAALNERILAEKAGHHNIGIAQ